MERFGIFWTIILCITTIIFYYFWPVIAPFFVAFIVSYFLEPIVLYFRKHLNCSRGTAVKIIFLLWGIITIALFLYLIPFFYQEIAFLIHKAPQYNLYVQNELTPYIVEKLKSIDSPLAEKIDDYLQTLFNYFPSFVIKNLSNLLNYTINTFSTLILILFVPILVFYFMNDWPRIIGSMMSLAPRDYKGTIKELIDQVDKLLSAFILGQAMMSLWMGLYYCTTFILIKLNLGLTLGVISGFLIAFPFIGFFISIFLVGFSILISDDYSTTKLIYLTVIYSFGHILETWILTPKIMGKNMKLHPLWVMFSLIFFGHILDIWGIFLALPLAGIIRIMVEFIIFRVYKKSIYFNPRDCSPP